MSGEMKQDFKDFIKVLSTEICKEVLLEDLKNINKALGDTNSQYDNLYNDYRQNLRDINREIRALSNSNKEIKNFTGSVDKNSKSINDALGSLDVTQSKFFNSILAENSKILGEYKVDIQKLNQKEREQFTSLLVSSIEEYGEQYLKDLSELINSSKLENMNETLIKEVKGLNSTVDFKINSAADRIIKNNRDNIKSLGEHLTTVISDVATELDKDIIDSGERVLNLQKEVQALRQEMNTINSVNRIMLICLLIMCAIIIVLLF